MILLDANVLIARFQATHPHHARVAAWWQREAGSGTPMTAPDLVWVGFVRIATHRRILSIPASVGQAWAFVDAVRAQPTYVEHLPDARALSLFRQMCLDGQAAGDLVPDAYIAAAARALGAEVATFDRDFRRFDGVRLVTPE